MAGARLASRPNRRALRSVPGETPRIPPQPRRPRAGHRDRSTASIDHRHRKIPPAFASNHLRSIRHYGIRMESERRRIGEVLRSIQLDHESIKYLLADDEKKRTAESSHCGAPEPQLRNHDGLTQPWQTDRVFAQKLEAVERSVGLVSPSDPDPDAALVAPPPLKSTQLG